MPINIRGFLSKTDNYKRAQRFVTMKNRNNNRFFGQAFSRKKGLRVSGSARVALRRERNSRPSGARKRVNAKIVLWTVLAEGKPCKRGLSLPCGNVSILNPTAEGRIEYQSGFSIFGGFLQIFARSNPFGCKTRTEITKKTPLQQGRLYHYQMSMISVESLPSLFLSASSVDSLLLILLSL